MREDVRKRAEAMLDAVAKHVELRVLSDPRHRQDMTDHELASLALTILQEDAVAGVEDETVSIDKLEADTLQMIVDTRVGLVPGLLAQQERGNG